MIKSILKFFSRKKETISAKELRDIHHTYFSGRVCNICKQPYVGVAQDCKCTGYNYDE